MRKGEVNGQKIGLRYRNSARLFSLGASRDNSGLEEVVLGLCFLEHLLIALQVMSSSAAGTEI